MSNKFSRAIVRIPAKSLSHGLTSAGLGLPNYNLGLKQHAKYIDALKISGLEVTILEADEKYPDSCFVEDVALCTPECAIVTNPGAASRQDETHHMKEVLRKFYKYIEYVHSPGTIDAGDIMMVGNHYFIGISERTNIEGANQMIKLLSKYGFSGSKVTLKKVLHLKTGLAYLENNNLLAGGEFVNKPEFNTFNIIEISNDESYAANCIWVNNFVIMPAGFPKTKNLIDSLNYHALEVDLSEFQKLDGGASCLSLRF